MWLLSRDERNQCPQEFQERLTQIGGLNRYDEPNFRIAWGQTETFRAGGYWADGFHGYRDLLSGCGEPAWMLMQWTSPEEYGTPELYYLRNHDEDTGLQILGEYPYSGRYEVLFKFIHKEFSQGQMKVEHMPLNDLILDMVVPIVMQARDISLEKKKAARMELKEREDREQVRIIEDARLNARLAFGGNAVSFTRQGCRTPLIDKKVKEMERNLSQAIAKVRSMGRGFSQHSA